MRIIRFAFVFVFSLQDIFWSWEKDDDFDTSISLGGDHINVTQWVDKRGNPLLVSGERAGNNQFNDAAQLLENREVIGQVDELEFRDPDHFIVRELHKYVTNWAENSEVSTLIELGGGAVLDRE